jgi:hypothetical protein
MNKLGATSYVARMLPSMNQKAAVHSFDRPVVSKLRALCLALPETSERASALRLIWKKESEHDGAVHRQGAVAAW